MPQTAASPSAFSSPTSAIAHLNSRQPVRLLQLSDCHLPQQATDDYRGTNADEGLRSVVERATSWKPHAVLASGDLSEDASADSYRRLLSLLEPLEAPILALPGNHDDVTVMSTFFPLGPWGRPLIQDLGHWLLVGFSSVIEGRVDGAIHQRDLRLAEAFLAEHPQRPAIVALHHQPIDADSPWIDRYRLQNQAELMDWVRRNETVRCVVWGHVHQARHWKIENCEWMSAPSTAANSLAGKERFSPDPAGPAGRWLELGPKGGLRTGLFAPLCD